MNSDKKSLSAEETSKIMGLAIRAGHILLENGAEIFRVEETSKRIAKYYGVESGDFFVLTNGIFATSEEPGGGSFAKVKYVPVKGSQLEKVIAVNQLSREIAEGKYTVEEANQRLDEIEDLKGKSYWAQVLSSALGSFCFCILFGGGLIDAVTSAIAGFILYIFMLSKFVKGMNKLTANVCGGALTTTVALIVFSLGLGINLRPITAGAVIPLVPGVAFTNGIRDIGQGDYLSGTVRLLDAMLVFMSIAIGMGFVFMAYVNYFGGALLW